MQYQKEVSARKKEIAKSFDKLVNSQKIDNNKYYSDFYNAGLNKETTFAVAEEWLRL